jgi:protease II
MQVWFYRVGSELSDAALLWHETDPAFYLSLSRTSSGRYLVLLAASEVSCVLVLVLVLLLLVSTHRLWVLVQLSACYLLQVTRESAALDLLAPSPPTMTSWIRLGQRQRGLQQHLSHWRDWFLLLTVAPDTPNGELRAAHVNNPSSSKVRRRPVCPRHRQQLLLHPMNECLALM